MKEDDPRVKEHFADLAKVIAKINDKALLEDFMRCLFTRSEIVDIAGRWALVKALFEKRMSQREIANDMSISLCKITRGSREMKKPNSAFVRVLEKRY